MEKGCFFFYFFLKNLEENLKLNQDLTSILHSSNVLLSERNDLVEQINLNNQKINHLENNTVQLDKITLNKLFGLIKNLPLSQSIGLFSTFFAIVGFAYYLGNLVKENSYLKDDFTKQKMIDSLKGKNKFLENEKTKLSKEIIYLNSANKKKNDTLKNSK